MPFEGRSAMSLKAEFVRLAMCLDRRHGGQPFGDIVNTFRRLCGGVHDAIRGKICDVVEG
jgi:hypothetical protein